MNIKYKKLIIIIAVVLSVIICVFYYINQNKNNNLEIYFSNLKRGRAVLIKTNDNKYILYGAGQNTEVIRLLTKHLPFYKRKVDYVFLPSANQNQIGGMIDIIDRYEIGQVYMPETFSTSTVLSIVLDKINKKKINLIKVGEGEEIIINDNLKIKILFPNNSFKYNRSSLPELVIGINYKNTNIILFGNISKTIQKYIFQSHIKNNDYKKESTIIEYYNSMPDTKMSKEILEYLKPKYIFNTKSKNINLISDGERWYEER